MHSSAAGNTKIDFMSGTTIRAVAAIAAAAFAVLSGGCHSIDDDRIPVAPVNIVFNTVADWNIYGVAGAMDHRSFIREKRVPSKFPYTASTYTGFGGVLLVCDVLGNPRAFDLSCPVEARQDVCVSIDEESTLACCPKCGSTYNVFSLMGHPESGPAADAGYGLRRYNVGPGRGGSAYMVVSY